MSFSSKVKEELAKKTDGARHCLIAETAALIALAGQILEKDDGSFEIYLVTENRHLASAFFYIVRRCFSYACEIRVQSSAGRMNWLLAVRDSGAALRILQACKVLQAEDPETDEEFIATDPVIIKNSCCRRAFLRGAFLAAGSANDPAKARSYHFEIVCFDAHMAELLADVFESFGIAAGTVRRRRYHVVYLKDGDDISEALNIIEAPLAMMEFENARIRRDLRARVNREVNCETANIGKTVTAAGQQIEDIRLIEERMGLEGLPEGLKEMARVRLDHPEASLAYLGELMTPPVGKSGVNHRLRRLAQIAAKLREGREA